MCGVCGEWHMFAGNSLYLETLQSKSGQTAAHEHCCYDNTKGSCENELSLGSLSVSDGQGKGNGSSKTSKHQHVLKTEIYLL